MEKKLYPITNSQRSIYLTEEYYKGTNINNITGTMLINKIVDFDKFILAIKQFVKQNDSCRLMLEKTATELKQYVCPYEDFDIKIINVSSKKELTDITNKICSKTFDLYNSYLFEFTVFRLPNNHGGFIINLHHLIGDSWTLGILVNEIISIYSSLVQNKTVDEKDCSLYSYINYIASEQEYKNSNRYNRDKAYWNDVFSSIPEIATIPYTCNNTNNSIQALRSQFCIPDEILSKINEYCSIQNISLFNFLTAIFSIYISKVSNLNDFCIGTPILNRSNFKEKNTTGMFINTLPLRITTDNNLSFNNFVNIVSSNSMALLRHQKYAYQNILEDLRKKQSDLPSLYNIMISYQITKMSDEQNVIPHESTWFFNGVTADDIDIHIFDLNDKNELNIAYDYNNSKYTYLDIEKIHNRILAIISQVLKNSNLPLSNIEIVTLDEKQKILSRFDNNILPYPNTKSIIELFENQVKRVPNAISIMDNTTKLTYLELLDKVNNLAIYLQECGISKGDIVATFLNRSCDLIISLLAIMKCGAIYLPISKTLPDERVNYILKDSGSKAVITTNIISFDNILQIELNKVSPKGEFKKITYNANDVIYTIYTSGSTGNPKGVQITNQNLNNFIHSFNKYFNNSISEKDICLSTTSISFDVSIWEFFISLLNGACLSLYPEDSISDIFDYCQTIVKQNITMLYIAPNILEEVYAILSKHNNICLNKILIGVEPILFSTMNKYFSLNPDMQIVNGYGPTETTICATAYVVSKNNSKVDSIIPIGKPLYNQKAYVVDPNFNLVPDGVVRRTCYFR